MIKLNLAEGRISHGHIIFLHYISQSYKGLNISRTCYPSLSNEYLLFLKLLYADDTVIVTENDRNLQMVLDTIDTIYNN